MKIRPHVHRQSATAAEVDAALARLDHAPGMYLGVDAGIEGLHPRQAVLLDTPALVLQVLGGGLQVQAASALGRALLAHPALTPWAAALADGGPPVAQLRTLMQAFEPLAEALLLGALRFHAHRLASGTAGANEPLGVLYLAQRFWRRDAAGAWEQVRLTLPGLPDDAATTPAAPSPGASTADTYPPQARDDHAPGGHADMVRRALGVLREQPLVSLTLSQSFRRPCTASAARAFDRLRRVNPAPVTFFLNDGSGGQLFGASPDLQLVVQGRHVQALPVCGTVARGAGPVGEAESFRELVNEAVDAASLAVCSDALREDLAPLCEPGSLRLLARRRQMSLATVVHTVDQLGGQLRAGCDAWDAILATTAPAMLTGTPRRHALAAIEALEASPRGWYGGLGLQLSADGDALVGTLLRAATLRDGVAEVRTGGDLLADSVPEREEQESRLKAVSLWRALGLEEAPTPTAAAAMTPPLPAAVAVRDHDDPFPQAVGEALQGLGLRLEARAPVTVLLGRALPVQPYTHAVALGDAALQLLAQAGAAVQPISPEHGRLVSCTTTGDAPWAAQGVFTAARYASLALVPGTPLPAGWQVWATDAAQQPVMLGHAGRRLACLLVRPESLLSSAQALQALRAALAFCGQGA